MSLAESRVGEREQRPALVRKPLLGIAVMAFLAYGAFTLAALQQPYMPFDVPLARAIQSVSWGPLLPVFTFMDRYLEGYYQVGVTIAGILLVLLVNRRAVFLMIAGALSGAAYSLTELAVHRPRPPAGLVHVIRHTQGFSYPSGHMVWFAWFWSLLILCLLWRRLAPPAVVLAWIVVALMVVAAGLGRIYLGEHWPSDVIGGSALGIGWTALILSIRKLSDPVLEPPGK